MSGEQEKKQFNYPKRDELIEEIKELDDEIQHVSLNLIKCDFNATDKDVKKAFPEFNFIKVKNYNPGSFEVVLEMKIDAINFIRNCYDRKILARRFYIKLGRQNKELVEDWSLMGYANGSKPNHQKKPFHKGPREDRPKKSESKEEGEENPKQEEGEKTVTEGPKKVEKADKKEEKPAKQAEQPKQSEEGWNTVPVKPKTKKK